jgi:hypothetical protein
MSIPPPTAAQNQWDFSESDDDEFLFHKPPAIYEQRVKELLQLLQDQSTTDTQKILKSYKKVLKWHEDDLIPEIVRRLQKEPEPLASSSSAPPLAATDPDEPRGAKRVSDAQLKQIALNKKIAMQRKLEKQEQKCAADVAQWNMRWTPAPPQ